MTVAPASCVQDSKSQVGDERALARSGRPNDSHVSLDRVQLAPADG